MNETLCRKVVKLRSGGSCEKCGMTDAIHMHHRKNRSQGGKWTPANVTHLCLQCHHHVTVNPNWAEIHGWNVRSHQDPAQIPVGVWYSILPVYFDDQGRWQTAPIS